MTENGKRVTALVVAFALGAAVGGAAAGYYGFSRGVSFVLNEALAGDAKEVQTLLGALEDLRAARTDAAIESLEARVDDQLIIFDPQTPYPVSGATISQVDAAIGAAKKYRSSYPRESKRPHVDAMVHNLLKRK